MRTRRWLAGIVFVIPVAYLAAILILQPVGHFVPPVDDTPDYFLPAGYSRLLYDDSDGIAWMIRAENARRGRLAGRVDETGKPVQPKPAKKHADYEALLAARPPLSDRYFLEYPPLALAFFRLGHLAAWSDGRADLSATLLDAHEFNFACHLPTDDTEREFYRGIRRGVGASTALLLLALMGVMLLIRRGIGQGGALAGSAWLCVLPAMLYFGACRFDILPAGLVLLAIASTARGRPNLGALALGAAIAFKLYPLILAPIILRFAFRSWRQAGLWCACCALPSLLANGVLILTDGWLAVTVPFQFQSGRPVEPLFIFYDRLIALALATGPYSSLFRNGSVLALVLILCIRKPPDVESLLRRCALAVMLFAALQVFYSPQWWLWFAVLLIPLARTHRGLAALIVLADLVTYATFPLAFDRIVIGSFDDAQITRVSDNLTKLRGLIWMGIAGVLIWGEVRGRKNSTPPLRFGEGVGG